MASLDTLPLPIKDGYYRIRSTSSKLSITMRYHPERSNLAHSTAESDINDGSQTFYVRHNPFTETYTAQNIGTGLYLGTFLTPGWEEWGIVGVAKPLPWKIKNFEDNKGGVGYRVFLPGHAEGVDRKGVYLTWWESGKIGMTWFERDWEWARSWKFEPADQPSDMSNIRPLTTLPPLLPGVFRIQNVGAQTVLEQSDEEVKSPILGNKPKTTKKPQEWIVSIDKETQLFLLKNAAYDTYLGIDSEDGSLVSCEQPLLWDIRQGDQPEQYLFHLPGLIQVLHVQDATNNFMNIVVQTRDRDQSALERWVFLPKTVDVTQVVQSTPPFFPPISNGTYRIVCKQTGKVLVESQTFVPKSDNAGRIVPTVTQQNHEHGNQHELWVVEVQPRVLTFTLKNLASGRYLIPPFMAERNNPGPRTCVYTSNSAFLWDIRQTWHDDFFTLFVPGTRFDIWCSERSTTGELCMWMRYDPPENWEQFRFQRAGDWVPSVFPQTFAEIEALSSPRHLSSLTSNISHAELKAASEAGGRSMGFLEVIIEYMKDTFKIDSASGHGKGGGEAR